jgi:hypothetical protein
VYFYNEEKKEMEKEKEKDKEEEGKKNFYYTLTIYQS